MDADFNIPRFDSKGFGDRLIVNLNYLLNLEVVIAGTERAHFLFLPFFGFFGYIGRVCPSHPAARFDKPQVTGYSKSLFDRPYRPAGEHFIKPLWSQLEFASTADAGRDATKQLVGDVGLAVFDVLNFKACMQGAHAAGNVKSHTAGGDNPILSRVKRPDAADTESISPVGIRHGKGCANNTRQRCDIANLFGNFVIHLDDQRFGGIDNAIDTHLAASFQKPFVLGTLFN